MDLVVTPSFHIWGHINQPVGHWGPPHLKAPMEVAIDMLPDKEEEEDTADSGENSGRAGANGVKDAVQDLGNKVVSGLAN